MISHLRCNRNFVKGKAEARFLEVQRNVHHHLILLRQFPHRRPTPLLRYLVEFKQDAYFYMLNAVVDTLKSARVYDKLNRFFSFKYTRGKKPDHSVTKRDSVRISQLRTKSSEAQLCSFYRNYNSPPEFSQVCPLTQHFRGTALANRMFSILVSLTNNAQKHNSECLWKSWILCTRIKFSASGHR